MYRSLVEIGKLSGNEASAWSSAAVNAPWNFPRHSLSIISSGFSPAIRMAAFDSIFWSKPLESKAASRFKEVVDKLSSKLNL